MYLFSLTRLHAFTDLYLSFGIENLDFSWTLSISELKTFLDFLPKLYFYFQIAKNFLF